MSSSVGPRIDYLARLGTARFGWPSDRPGCSRSVLAAASCTTGALDMAAGSTAGPAAAPLSHPAELSETARAGLAVLLRRLEQFLQRRVHDLRARSARPLVADGPLVIDQVERRCGGEVPLHGDRPRAGVA